MPSATMAVHSLEGRRPVGVDRFDASCHRPRDVGPTNGAESLSGAGFQSALSESSNAGIHSPPNRLDHLVGLTKKAPRPAVLV